MLRAQPVLDARDSAEQHLGGAGGGKGGKGVIRNLATQVEYGAERPRTF